MQPAFFCFVVGVSSCGPFCWLSTGPFDSLLRSPADTPAPRKPGPSQVDKSQDILARYFSRRPVGLEFALVWPPLRQCLALVSTIVQQRLRPTLAFCQAPSRLRIAPALRQCLGRQLAFCWAPARLRRLRVDFSMVLSMSRFVFVPAPVLLYALGFAVMALSAPLASLTPATLLTGAGAMSATSCTPSRSYVSIPEGSTHPASVFSPTVASLKASMSSRDAGGSPDIVSTHPASCGLVAHHSETGASRRGFSLVRVSGSEGENNEKFRGLVWQHIARCLHALSRYFTPPRGVMLTLNRCPNRWRRRPSRATSWAQPQYVTFTI